MTHTPPLYTEFKDLRRQAIGYAQDASGNIWTDYNLHDPGVTLLEQTCFALSEVAYQASHKARDLLTNTDDEFATGEEEDLYHPKKVLGSDPVTQKDLTAFLSDGTLVARAWVESEKVQSWEKARPGLYTITAVPVDDSTSIAAIKTEIKSAFARVRPLCCDIATVIVARRKPMVLSGPVEVSPTAIPERVAAEFYYAVSSILRGLPELAEGEAGAKRSDVYKNPIALLQPPGTNHAKTPDLDSHLNILRQLPGVLDIGKLMLNPIKTKKEVASDRPSYFASVLPRTDNQVELDLMVNGTKLVLNATAVREEYYRIAAERIGMRHHHIDEQDWSVLYPGRRREFSMSHVDSLLPMLYRAHGYDPAQTDALLTEYRSAIDTHISDMSAELGALPKTFSARTDPDIADPALHRRRIALLDYLIALKGEELPATRHTGIHHYRSPRERYRFEITWRLQFLYAISDLNATRNTGPRLDIPGGFLAKLGILADLKVFGCSSLTDPLKQNGVTLDDTAEMPVSDRTTKTLIRSADYSAMSAKELPDVLFDVLVPYDESVEPLPAADLKILLPGGNGQMKAGVFARLADPSRFLAVPGSGHGWAVLFDPSYNQDPVRLENCADKDAAQTLVQQLRAAWRAIHQDCEGAYFVEDVHLRAPSGKFTASTATLVVSGWTARTSLTSYRNYISRLVTQLSPAHLHIKVLWLDVPGMQKFEVLHANSAANKKGSHSALRTYLQTAESCP